MDVGELELRHLRCLVAIAEEGTVTDAAIALGLSQPAVSRTLAQLEGLVGVRLVERTTRKLALTEEGTQFRDQALRVIATIDDAVATARGSVRPLRIGYSWAAAGRHTNPILRRWRAAHPDVELQVRRFDDRTAGLGGGSVDLALVRVVLDEPHFVSERVFDEPRLVAMAVDHPFAQRKRLTLGDLRHEMLALSTRAGTTTLDLWPPGEAPERSVDVDNVDEWLTVVESGQGVGVTAASTADQHPRRGIAYVPLRGAPPITTWIVYDDRRQHPRQQQFLAVVRAVVRGRPT